MFSPRRLLALCAVGLAATLMLHTLFASELEALFSTLVLVKESRAQNIYVVRKDNMAMLKSGGLFINNNVYNPERPFKHYLEYTALLCLGAVYCDNPKSILVIGLAGGTVPMYLKHHYPEAEITCVDFDAAMKDVAVEYFGFREGPEMRVVIQDGRVFLRQDETRYDLMVLDAFDGRNVPFHMCTREFLESCKSRLRPGGVLVSNTPGGDDVDDRYLATYLSVFPRVDVFEARRARNRILIAHDGSAPSARAPLAALFAARQRERDFAEMDVARLFEQNFVSAHGRGAAPAPEAEPFSDDFAPVNLLLPPVHLKL